TTANQLDTCGLRPCSQGYHLRLTRHGFTSPRYDRTELAPVEERCIFLGSTCAGNCIHVHDTPGIRHSLFQVAQECRWFPIEWTNSDRPGNAAQRATSESILTSRQAPLKKQLRCRNRQHP